MNELTPKAQREMEEAWNLRREAVILLGHVVAEWESDPKSVQCFDSAEIYTEKCPRCRGDGHEPGFGHSIAPAAVSPCKRCKGSGEV